MNICLNICESFKYIKITPKSGRISEWETEEKEYGDYCYNEKTLVIRKKGRVVAIYNMDSVASVVIK